MPNRVLVVEDSVALNELMCLALRKAGYEAEGFLDAESLIESVLLKDAQIIVLDIQLPGEDGLQLAERLRPLMPNLGILMLTTRSSNASQVAGYDAGSDYYLPKPIAPEELIAAVNSLLRRKQQASQAGSANQRCVYCRTTLNLSYGECSVRLSDSDAAILVGLASAPGHELAHWQIMDLLGIDQDKKKRSALDVRIYRLRAKLSALTGNYSPILSIRGVGYRLGMPLEID
jgi:DNA-binding response OmpR family regulator